MPALRFDLINAVVSHGAQFSPDEIVDPSTSQDLRKAGLALVTTYIEQLSLIEIVRDPAPLFGVEGGMWIGYRLTDLGRDLSKSESALRQAVAELIEGPKTEVGEAVKSLHEACGGDHIHEKYRENFLRTLEEIRICFDEGCYMATIAFCGKILEVSLKEVLQRNNIDFNDKTTLGKLINIVRANVVNEYVDSTLSGLADIIMHSRNITVHAPERIPVPSRDQAISVIFATREVVLRNLSHK